MHERTADASEISGRSCAPSREIAGINAPLRATCRICPHRCTLSEGAVGRCRARIARDGEVIPLNYGLVTSIALDPIEKKPLARFYPGSTVLSVGSFGCNLSCPFCQNASIAQVGKAEVRCRSEEPEELVERALDLVDQGCVGIAYTYNEPVVGFEFVRDCARLAHAAGLVNVLVSNGMICEEPLCDLAPLIDAANIDLKGFSQDFYDFVGGDYQTVRRTIEKLARLSSCHLEVTTLVIPGLNDDIGSISEASRWLASLDPGIVYHLTRFFPQHRMVDRQATPLNTLRAAAEAARVHLDDVLLGNC